MRVALLTFAGLGTACVASMALASSAHATNFLIIVLDDLGADKVSSYLPDMYPTGSSPEYLPETPAIDALAAAGLRFSTAYANPACAPTRASLMMGQHPFQTGMAWGAEGVGSSPDLPTENTTIAEALAVGGTTNGIFGKWHFGATTPGGTDWTTPGVYDEPPAPSLHGFSAYRGSLEGQVYNYYNWREVTWPLSDGTASVQRNYSWVSEVTTDDTYNWILDQSEPWLAVASLNAPHLDAEGDHGVWELDDLAPGSTCAEYDGDDSCSQLELLAAMVGDADDAVGALLNDLAAADPAALEDTVILLFGDNGTETAGVEAGWLPSGDRTRAGKATPYESGTRIPLVVTRGCDWMDQADGSLDGRYPSGGLACQGATVDLRTPGLVVDAPVHVTDIYATVLELSGSDDEVPAASHSLASCLSATVAEGADCGNPDLTSRAIYYEAFSRPNTEASEYGTFGPAADGAFGMRVDDHKLIGEVTDSSDGACMRYQLFDLAADPYETEELLGSGTPLSGADAAAFQKLGDTLRLEIAPDWRLPRNCTPGGPWDVDADGFDGASAGGTDCDDGNDGVYAGAPDAWYDGIDSDCDGSDDYDQDYDGFPTDTDCDDLDPAHNPATPEIADDGIDQNCDGVDLITPPPLTDADADGFMNDVDCDDLDPQSYPGAPEIWYDGIDQGCDGGSDGDYDGDGYDAIRSHGPDCNDNNPYIKPGGIERRGDHVDQNCNGPDNF